MNLSMLEPHQERVIHEQRDLSERMQKLSAFIASDAFNVVPQAERSRLIRQLCAMEQLDHVLLERINAFGRGD